MAIHGFGESDGAVLQADMDVLAVERGIANLVGSGGADANAAKLPVEGQSRRRRFLPMHMARAGEQPPAERGLADCGYFPFRHLPAIRQDC